MLVVRSPGRRDVPPTARDSQVTVVDAHGVEASSACLERELVEEIELRRDMQVAGSVPLLVALHNCIGGAFGGQDFCDEGFIQVTLALGAETNLPNRCGKQGIFFDLQNLLIFLFEKL